MQAAIVSNNLQLMQTIALSNGGETLVSDEDYAHLSRFNWYKHFSDGNWYVKGWVDGKLYHLARYLMGSPSRLKVDHRNGNTLDNQRHNLRVATNAQNGGNRKFFKPTHSGVNGVSWEKSTGKWRATIGHNWKAISLGRFKNKEDAIRARIEAEQRLLGEFSPSLCRAA